MRLVLHRGPAPAGAVRPLRAAARAGRPAGPAADTCAGCAGIPVFSACAECGTEDKLYEKGRCPRCSLRRRARQLLAGRAGTVPPALAGVLEAITATRQPRVALNWMRQGAGAALLADAAAGRLPLTHEALDASPRRKAADYLRHMLTASGALPQRDEHLARTERWLQELLAGIEPAEDRKLVQAYATWQVVRRLRASAENHQARTPTANARNNIRAAASLLAWLRSRRTTLTDCQQGDIDQWLRTGPPASLARDFLTWAASRRHAQRLGIPAPARPAAPLSARTSDGHTPPGCCTTTRWTRPTGHRLLLLLTASRYAHAAMTTSQVIRSGQPTLIQLGRHPVPSPTRSPAPSPSSSPTGEATAASAPTADHLAVPRTPARPPHHPGHARRTPTGPRHLRPDRTPRRPPRPRRPAPAAVPPTCSACTTTPPPDGCTKPEVTGPAMQPS